MVEDVVAGAGAGLSVMWMGTLKWRELGLGQVAAWGLEGLLEAGGEEE